MTQKLEESWSSFPDDIAKRYLIDFGKGSETSKMLSYNIIKRYYPESVNIIEFGCGNCQYLESLIEYGLDNFIYTGVDFSKSLLEVARSKFSNNKKFSLISKDIHDFEPLEKSYDLCIFSHVIELLSSPEQALMNASRIASKILIRWYEPPNFTFDSVELRDMPIDEENFVPFIRRKMSRSYYQLILSNIGILKVDIFKDKHSKDEIHLLHIS